MHRPGRLLALLAVPALLSCGTADREHVVVRAEPPSVSSTTISTTNSQDQNVTTTTIDNPMFAQWLEGVAAARWIDAVVANKRAGAGSVSHVVRSPSPAPPSSGPEGAEPPVPPGTPSGPRRRVTNVIPDELVPFFECVIDHESGSAGVYTAVQHPSGKYRGAYQADRQFFLAFAPVEWHHLADPPAWEQAPPEVQDQMALNGYRARGASPWMGICRQYG